MLLHAVQSCCGAQLTHCSRGINPRSSLSARFTLAVLQQRATQAQASSSSRQMEVVAAAEATASELQGLRLDSALSVLFPGRWNSSTALKRTVRRGEILVNGSTAKIDHTLQLGDKVQVITRVGCTNKTAAQFHKQQQQSTLPGLDVAWEDDDMAVIIKPQALLSQGPKGPASVAGRVKYCLKPTSLPGAMSAPKIAHRLDVGTGGLMMVSKTRAVAAQLTKDLTEHSIQKRYLALVLGRLNGSGVIDCPVGGSPAVSLYRVEGHRPSVGFGCLTLVSLWPKTGKTHQLRKHMAYIGHPILGDLQYKNHRKPECTVTDTVDITALLPDFSSTAVQDEGQPGAQALSATAAPAAALRLAAAAGGVQVQQQQQCVDSNAAHQLPDQQQQQQALPILRIVSPVVDLPVFDGQNPHHNEKISATAAAAVAAGSSNASGSNKHKTPQPPANGHSPSVVGVAAGSGLAAQQQQQQQQQKRKRSSSDGGEPHATTSGQAAEGASGAAAATAVVAAAAGGGEETAAAAAANSDADADDVSVQGSEGGNSLSSAQQSCRHRGQVLADGTVVGTCLWAVQLQLRHPATGQVLDISTDESVLQLYDRICALDAPAAVAV